MSPSDHDQKSKRRQGATAQDRPKIAGRGDNSWQKRLIAAGPRPNSMVLVVHSNLAFCSAIHKAAHRHGTHFAFLWSLDSLDTMLHWEFDVAVVEEKLWRQAAGHLGRRQLEILQRLSVILVSENDVGAVGLPPYVKRVVSAAASPDQIADSIHDLQTTELAAALGTSTPSPGLQT